VPGTVRRSYAAGALSTETVVAGRAKAFVGVMLGLLIADQGFIHPFASFYAVHVQSYVTLTI
jgi:hypothetical protein